MTIKPGSELLYTVESTAAELPESLFAREPRAELSRSRLTDLERDRRFETSYIRVGSDCNTTGVLPLYYPRVENWPDSAYDVGAVLGGSSDARKWALAGGRADRHSGFLSDTLDVEIRRGYLTAALLHAREHAWSAGRQLAALYVDLYFAEAAKRVGVRRKVEMPPRYALSAIGRDVETFVANLRSSNSRKQVRRDLRKLSDAGTIADVEAWSGVLSEAVPLICERLARHGIAEPALLVADRLQRWIANSAVECVAFTLRIEDGLVGATLAWVCRGRLTLYELGLSRNLPDRALAYAELVFYAPLRFAWEHQITEIDLGFKSDTPKLRRGAEPRTTFGLSFAAEPDLDHQTVEDPRWR